MGLICTKNLSIDIGFWAEYAGPLRHFGGFWEPNSPNVTCAAHTISLSGLTANITATSFLPYATLVHPYYVPPPCTACGITDLANFDYAAIGSFTAPVPGTATITWSLSLEASICMGICFFTWDPCIPMAGIFGNAYSWFDTYVNGASVDTQIRAVSANYVTPNPTLVEIVVLPRHVAAGDVLQYMLQVKAETGDGDTQTVSATFHFAPD